MRDYKAILICSSVLVLGACGYAVESSNQDISFVTPGAEDARCYVNVNKIKYKVYPPQTLNIKKSDKDMLITCNAPGNRVREMTVPATMTARALWGTPVGMAWDYASQSLFYYPSVIAIDFSQEQLVPNKPPKHNNADIKQPEEYDLEEFLPADPRLNSDKDKIGSPLVRKGDTYSDYAVSDMDGGSSDKGNLQDVIDDLTSKSSENAAGEPVSLYPGQ
ncbi:MAG: hypothetical protein ACRBDI_00350 [Alphaproteobacteria bacterium]